MKLVLIFVQIFIFNSILAQDEVPLIKLYMDRAIDSL